MKHLRTIAVVLRDAFAPHRRSMRLRTHAVQSLQLFTMRPTYLSLLNFQGHAVPEKQVRGAAAVYLCAWWRDIFITYR